MTLRAIIAAVAFAASGAAAQSFSVVPASPTVMDPIYVQKSFDNEDEAHTTVSMAGNRITVRMYQGTGFPEPPPGTTRARIGRLPEGTYQVELFQGDATTSLGTVPVTVGPRPAGLAPNDFSDIWWNPAESGWGLDLVQHPSGMIFATWFVYAADGVPVWYVIPGGHWNGPTVFEGAIYRTTGPQLTAFSSQQVTVTPVGNATLFFGLQGLSATFTVDGKTVTKQLQRQSF